MSQPVGEERPFTFVLTSAHTQTHTRTQGVLTGDELILSGQARVRCLHPGIKLQKRRFPPIALRAVELFRGWTEAERQLSAQSVCRAVISKWMNSKPAQS